MLHKNGTNARHHALAVISKIRVILILVWPQKVLLLRLSRRASCAPAHPLNKQERFDNSKRAQIHASPRLRLRDSLERKHLDGLGHRAEDEEDPPHRAQSLEGLVAPLDAVEASGRDDGNARGERLARAAVDEELD